MQTISLKLLIDCHTYLHSHFYLELKLCRIFLFHNLAHMNTDILHQTRNARTARKNEVLSSRPSFKSRRQGLKLAISLDGRSVTTATESGVQFSSQNLKAYRETKELQNINKTIQHMPQILQCKHTKLIGRQISYTKLVRKKHQVLALK